MAVPDLGLSLCVGSGDINDAQARTDIANTCGQSLLYLGSGRQERVNLTMEVDAARREDWLTLSALGAVLQSSLKGNTFLKKILILLHCSLF